MPVFFFTKLWLGLDKTLYNVLNAGDLFCLVGKNPMVMFGRAR